MTEQELERCLPFLRALAESRGDPVVRGQFADYLDECGFPDEAKGQRWAARNGKRPDRRSGWWPPPPNDDRNFTLPEDFWNEDRQNDDGVWDPLFDAVDKAALDFERDYLLRCGEMLWGDGGEPLARYKPAAEVATRPQS